MTEQDTKPHCHRCGRSIKPRWYIHADEFEDTHQAVGPTCRKKWIASGEYCEDDFVDTNPKKERGK